MIYTILLCLHFLLNGLIAGMYYEEFLNYESVTKRILGFFGLCFFGLECLMIVSAYHFFEYLFICLDKKYRVWFWFRFHFTSHYDNMKDFHLFEHNNSSLNKKYRAMDKPSTEAKRFMKCIDAINKRNNYTPNI